MLPPLSGEDKINKPKPKNSSFYVNLGNNQLIYTCKKQAIKYERY